MFKRIKMYFIMRRLEREMKFEMLTTIYNVISKLDPLVKLAMDEMESLNQTQNITKDK